MHDAGGGSFGPERERHVGGGNGYAIIEKVENPEFKFTHAGTPQYFEAPKTAVYTMTAVGAKGGDCNGCDKATCLYCTGTKDDRRSKNCTTAYMETWCFACDAQYHEGGYGALARRKKLLLRKGDKLKMIVGGKGQDCQKIRQPLRFNYVINKGGTSRPYMEAVTGAGGGGATSVIFQHDDGREDLYLTVGGGGGAAYFFNGEDAEIGPNGGFDWGGRSGGGGGLGPLPKQYAAYGGAGGGGIMGDGTSRKEGSKVRAEGGFSLSNGSRGGYDDWRYYYYKQYEDYEGTKRYKEYTVESGGAGGYGFGGQGGTGE